MPLTTTAKARSLAVVALTQIAVRSRAWATFRRPARRAAAVLAAVIVLVFGAAANASAHATVVSTSPGFGAVLSSAPSTVAVTFDEPVEVAFGGLRVFAPGGARVDTGRVEYEAGHTNTVTVALNAGLGSGTYTVAWRVVSADSHPVQGAFTFSIGAASASVVTPGGVATGGSRAVGLAFGAVRWLGFAGFVLLIGVGTFLFTCWPAGADDRTVRRLLIAAWSVSAGAAGGSLLLQGPYGAGLGIGKALDTSLLAATATTRLGAALIARLVLLAAVAALLGLIPGRLRAATSLRRVVLAVPVAGLALGLAATWAVADHAGTGMQAPLAIAVDIGHLCAMAVWIGGLIVLSVVLLRSRDIESINMATRRFSAIAFGCVAILVLTGTYQSWRQVGTVPALTSTAYGRLLLAKIAGFCLLVTLGYLSRHWLAHHLAAPPRLPRPARRTEPRRLVTPDTTALAALRRSACSEVVVAVCVLGLTAALVAAEPARQAYTAPVERSVGFDTGGPQGVGKLNMILEPAKVGADTVHLFVFGTDGQAEPGAAVTAALWLPARQLGPLPVALAVAGPGHYQAVTPVPIAGTWTLSVTVRTDDVDETTVRLPVAIR